MVDVITLYLSGRTVAYGQLWFGMKEAEMVDFKWNERKDETKLRSSHVPWDDQLWKRKKNMFKKPFCWLFS